MRCMGELQRVVLVKGYFTVHRLFQGVFTFNLFSSKFGACTNTKSMGVNKLFCLINQNVMSLLFHTC